MESYRERVILKDIWGRPAVETSAGVPRLVEGSSEGRELCGGEEGLISRSGKDENEDDIQWMQVGKTQTRMMLEK